MALTHDQKVLQLQQAAEQFKCNLELGKAAFPETTAYQETCRLQANAVFMAEIHRVMEQEFNRA